MRRWRWHILLFIAVYGVTLLATLPATLALHWAEPVLAHMPQRPQLLGMEGTVWSGRAAQVNYRGISLGELHWNILPWALLLGRIDVSLEITGDDTYLDSVLSTGLSARTWRLRKVSGQLPASLAKRLMPSLPVTPDGTFALVINEARFGAAKLQALDGRIVWNKGGVTSPLALEFGDLVAEFSNGETGIAGRVHDSGGPLHLEAELKLGADGSYTLSGKSAARPGAAPSLVTSLSLLGQPDAKGMIPFRFTGRL